MPGEPVNPGGPPQFRTHSESGISLIEVMIAGLIFLICSVSVLGLITASIGTNNRNKVDSTQVMLAGSIIEQVTSTLIGSGTSTLTDCAGTTWTIETTPGGAATTNARIDFSEPDPPDDYFMNYVVNTPCIAGGARQAIYDLRWNVEVHGTTNTYLITVGAIMKDTPEGSPVFPPPVHLRVMAGN